MVAVTYNSARVVTVAPASAKTSTPAKKGFFARFMDALMEARLRQAEREIEMHRHLFHWNHDPNTVDQNELPFGR
jgi:hypothetical protein